MPRVLSLVPSWTETLVKSGAKVVGRTRYCIHPKEELQNIPMLGGTKSIGWGDVESLKPDLVLMDKEENTLEMAESCPYPVFATHIRSIEDLPEALSALSQHCGVDLSELSLRWQKVLDTKPTDAARTPPVPGQIEWLSGDASQPMEKLVYVIWRKPWMAVGETCFIWSVMKKLGLDCYAPAKGAYPEFNFEELSSKECSFLFSSEPYPFHKKRTSLSLENNQKAALVDGELYSWFGIRSLSFLEKELKLKTF